MFGRFFTAHPAFQIVQKPDRELIELYRLRVPDDLLEFWKQFGFGNFMNGYLKILHPSVYQGFMQATYSVYKEPTIVFGATGFGDLLIWEGEYVKQLNYRLGTTKNCGSSIEMLFDVRFARWDVVEQSMQAKQFRPAVERLGEPAFDECFAYVPALALGGSEKVENIQKVKLREHLSILSQIVGVIE
ncbi:MAG: DUF1851 domain-containing protein [Bacteroidetes bacterium]|nr:DUF1851 domain-containing protein [Bacteroidota bacterium]MBL0020103.1 DUF1851 domain-containing protein [Bacteroidota bacterium]MBP6721111.1 DUF1851 domain-containing protein [Bacteroidia bacterium]MBP8073385.1 DUF1851 domain-containing protein [Bacteroidia bacterium]